MLRIKLHRMSQGLSQWELSRTACMSQGRYSMIERGLIEPTGEERERLSQTLAVSASTLFRSVVRTRRQPEEQIVSDSEV